MRLLENYQPIVRSVGMGAAEAVTRRVGEIAVLRRPLDFEEYGSRQKQVLECQCVSVLLSCAEKN